MTKMTVGLCAFVLAGTLATDKAGAQGGTAPQSQSMGASRSGSAVDSDSATSTTKDQFDKGFTGQAPGIGEKGSGQSRSTMERSGGKQGFREKGAQSSDSSQGKNAQSRQRQPHDESSH